MAKVLDITDRLGLGGRPKLKIGEVEVEVRDGARDVLKVLSLVGDGEDMEPQKLTDVYEALFSDEARAEIDNLDLGYQDFLTLLFAAIDLITGDGGDAGKAGTPATTS